MKLSLNPSRILFVIVAALCFLLLKHGYDVASEDEVRLTVHYTSDSKVLSHNAFVDAAAQVKESQPYFLTTAAKPRPMNYLVPKGQFNALLLRFEAVDCTVTLFGARLVNRAGTIDRQVRFAPGARPVQGMNVEQAPDGSIRLRMSETMEEPGVLIPFVGEPLENPPTRLFPGGAAWLAGAVGGLLALLLVVLYDRLGLKEKGGLWQMLAARPKLAVCAVALLANFIALWPVFLDGRGMTGPYVPFLYDHATTLPGQSDNVLVPKTNWVDTSAIVYTSYGQMRQAVKHFWETGEFLLWDRFNSSGATYLGQGQFVMLCPLLLPVLLGGSTLTAWTVALVLARLVFSVAFGLYVLRLRVDFRVAFWITAASAFLEIFMYRNAHFANLVACGFPLLLLGLDGYLDRREAGWKRALYLLVWLTGCFTCINSAALKEGMFTMTTATAVALGLRFFAENTWAARLRMLGWMSAAGVVFLLLIAPVLLVFLFSVKQSTTVYDYKLVFQLPLEGFLGLFEEYYIRILYDNYRQSAPGLSLLFLPGFIFAVLGCFQARERYRFLVPVLLALACAVIAVRVIPADLLLNLPFLGQIMSYHNSFGLSALPSLMVASVFGWDLWLKGRTGAAPAWLFKGGLAAMAVVLALGSVYQLKLSLKTNFPTLLLMGLILTLCAMMVPLLVWRLTVDKERFQGLRRGALLVAMLGCWVVLTARYIYYSHPKMTPIYTVLPELVKGDAPSETCDWLLAASKREPGRAIGTDSTLFSGIGPYYGLEGAAGAMPLRDPRYWDYILNFPGGQMEWVWDLNASNKNIRGDAPFLEFLNVRYLVSMPGQRYLGGGPPVVHTGDLEVRELPLAWPRAFWVDQVLPMATLGDLFTHLNGRPGIFCAVSPEVLAAHPELQALVAPAGSKPKSVAAKDYHLTLNNTSFTVEAAGPGVIVLHEVFSKDAFQVTLNGQPVEPVLVNHMFRGLPVKAAGTYKVEYRYWPAALTRGLWLGAAGLVALAALVVYLLVAIKPPPSHGDPSLPDPEPAAV
jgi:hypothetical protein